MCNKNVNRNIGEVDRMSIVLSNKPYMLNVSFTYSAWTLFFLPFSNFLVKNLKVDTFFVFSGTRFHIWGPLYVTVSVPYFAVLLFGECRHWNSLDYTYYFLSWKHYAFVYFFSKIFQVILVYCFLLSHFKNVLERTNMVVMN